MNNLKSLFNQLAQSVSSVPYARIFAEAAPGYPALAGYDSPRAVLDVLQANSSFTVEERDAILVALLAELRATKGKVWQAILVLAFQPMLVRIRARLGQPKVTRFGRSQADDLDQRVFLAFLEAAGTLHITSHAARALGLAVKRRVFEDETREREAFAPDEFTDDEYEHDPFEVTTREKAAANEVVGIVDAEGGAELRDMMVATRAHGEALRLYVARTYPELPAKSRRAIERRLAQSANQMERKLRARAQRSERRSNVKAA